VLAKLTVLAAAAVVAGDTAGLGLIERRLAVHAAADPGKGVASFLRNLGAAALAVLAALAGG